MYVKGEDQVDTALTATAASNGDAIANTPKTISRTPQMIDHVEAWRTMSNGECSAMETSLMTNQRSERQ